MYAAEASRDSRSLLVSDEYLKGYSFEISLDDLCYSIVKVDVDSSFRPNAKLYTFKVDSYKQQFGSPKHYLGDAFPTPTAFHQYPIVHGQQVVDQYNLDTYLFDTSFRKALDYNELLLINEHFVLPEAFRQPGELGKFQAQFGAVWDDEKRNLANAIGVTLSPLDQPKASLVTYGRSIQLTTTPLQFVETELSRLFREGIPQTNQDNFATRITEGGCDETSLFWTSGGTCTWRMEVPANRNQAWVALVLLSQYVHPLCVSNLREIYDACNAHGLALAGLTFVDANNHPCEWQDAVEVTSPPIWHWTPLTVQVRGLWRALSSTPPQAGIPPNNARLQRDVYRWFQTNWQYILDHGAVLTGWYSTLSYAVHIVAPGSGVWRLHRATHMQPQTLTIGLARTFMLQPGTAMITDVDFLVCAQSACDELDESADSILKHAVTPFLRKYVYPPAVVTVPHPNTIEDHYADFYRDLLAGYTIRGQQGQAHDLVLGDLDARWQIATQGTSTYASIIDIPIGDYVGVCATVTYGGQLVEVPAYLVIQAQALLDQTLKASISTLRPYRHPWQYLPWVPEVRLGKWNKNPFNGPYAVWTVGSSLTRIRIPKRWFSGNITSDRAFEERGQSCALYEIGYSFGIIPPSYEGQVYVINGFLPTDATMIYSYPDQAWDARVPDYPHQPNVYPTAFDVNDADNHPQFALVPDGNTHNIQCAPAEWLSHAAQLALMAPAPVFHTTNGANFVTYQMSNFGVPAPTANANTLERTADGAQLGFRSDAPCACAWVDGGFHMLSCGHIRRFFGLPTIPEDWLVPCNVGRIGVVSFNVPFQNPLASQIIEAQPFISFTSYAPVHPPEDYVSYDPISLGSRAGKLAGRYVDILLPDFVNTNQNAAEPALGDLTDEYTNHYGVWSKNRFQLTVYEWPSPVVVKAEKATRVVEVENFEKSQTVTDESNTSDPQGSS